MINLNEEQIINLLEKNLDSNTTDKDYEKTEDILTDIKCIQNLGDSSIFTDTFYLVLMFRTFRYVLKLIYNLLCS
jgi:hypothetical protein